VDVVKTKNVVDCRSRVLSGCLLGNPWNQPSGLIWIAIVTSACFGDWGLVMKLSICYLLASVVIGTALENRNEEALENLLDSIQIETLEVVDWLIHLYFGTDSWRIVWVVHFMLFSSHLFKFVGYSSHLLYCCRFHLV
jgi:hypothetical protein